MAAILDFNRKWIFFRLPSYLKLKILLKTMFVPSFMLVPQKAVFFDILQLSAGLLWQASGLNFQIFMLSRSQKSNVLIRLLGCAGSTSHWLHTLT